MKRVLSNSNAVIHLFAQQTQSDARCTNVFFELDRSKKLDYGTKLYSYGYHYLLAEFLDANTIWINDDGYSVTTSKQIGEVRYASRQYKRFLKSETDLQTVYNTVISCKNSLAKAKKPELYIEPILSLWETLNEFLVFSKAKKYKSNPMYKEIKAIVTALNIGAEDFKEQLKVIEAGRKRKDAVKLKKSLVKFYNYEIDSVRIGDEDFLRLSECGEKVETTQGIKVRRESAKLLYRSIINKVEIKGTRIDGYLITSINGTLKIGCHNINMESVHKVGKLL